MARVLKGVIEVRTQVHPRRAANTGVACLAVVAWIARAIWIGDSADDASVVTRTLETNAVGAGVAARTAVRIVRGEIEAPKARAARVGRCARRTGADGLLASIAGGALVAVVTGRSVGQNRPADTAGRVALVPPALVVAHHRRLMLATQQRIAGVSGASILVITVHRGENTPCRRITGICRAAAEVTAEEVG